MELRVAVAREELHQPVHLAAILFDADDLLAWPQAAHHFAINAAGMLGRGEQILLATPDLKQVEHFLFKALGRDARAERAEMKGSRSAQASRDRGPRELVGKQHLDERQGAEADHALVLLGEMVARYFVKQQARFQLGGGRLILDATRNLSQVEPARHPVFRTQQAAQPAAKEAGFREIRPRLGVIRPRPCEEDRRAIGHRGEVVVERPAGVEVKRKHLL